VALLKFRINFNRRDHSSGSATSFCYFSVEDRSNRSAIRRKGYVGTHKASTSIRHKMPQMPKIGHGCQTSRHFAYRPCKLCPTIMQLVEVCDLSSSLAGTIELAHAHLAQSQRGRFYQARAVPIWLPCRDHRGDAGNHAPAWKSSPGTRHLSVNDGAGLRGAACAEGTTKDTGRARLPISISGMIDTPASINSLVTAKGGDSFTLIWSRPSADWSHGIDASPSKRLHIGVGHKAACYSCLRCRPFYSLL
jgi:hypothetical protein